MKKVFQAFGIVILMMVLIFSQSSLEKSGGRHFHVLDGYFSNEDRTYIKVTDPWYSNHYDYSYDYYKSNSKFWWKLYIDSFSKI